MDEIRKGGLFEGDKLMDLHVVVAKPLLEITAEYYRTAVLEKELHKKTLALLAEVIAGEVDPASVIVTPSGWQIKQPRPQAEVDPLSVTVTPNAWDGPPDVYVASLDEIREDNSNGTDGIEALETAT